MNFQDGSKKRQTVQPGQPVARKNMHMLMAKRKITRCTALQLRYLVEYMVANPDLLSGALTPALVDRKNAKLHKLRKILKRYGPDKSLEQWKHTWRDVVRKNRNRLDKDGIALDPSRESELIQQAFENAKNYDFCNEEKWTSNKMWISLDDNPRNVMVKVVKQECEDPLYESVEYLDQEQFSELDPTIEFQSNQPSPSVPVSTQNLQIVLEPLKINSATSQQESLPVPSPASSSSTLPSPEASPRIKQTNTQDDTNSRDNDDVRETYDSGQYDRDIDVLNTLNKFIEYEKEKDKHQHEREMTRIKQADKLLNVMDKIANVFVDLAPSIKNFLERDGFRGEGT